MGKTSKQASQASRQAAILLLTSEQVAEDELGDVDLVLAVHLHRNAIAVVPHGNQVLLL